MKEIIAVSHLKKSFHLDKARAAGSQPQTLEVIKDISFCVHKGEVLGVIGPSGSGKSTMLRCINQLETVSDGTIDICGETLVRSGVYADKKTLRRIGLRSGMVFQNFNLFPHFTALRNIAEAQVKVLGIERREAEETARALLAKMGLSGKEYAYPYELSGGQQQRVSIARALALKPEVLCFDEPTSALDPELTGEILKVIKSLAQEKMTMIVVTHEMAFARDLADRIIFMDGGVIVEEGDAASVITNPQSERTKAFLSRFSAS